MSGLRDSGVIKGLRAVKFGGPRDLVVSGLLGLRIQGLRS